MALGIFTEASGLWLDGKLDGRKDIQSVKSTWSILHSELKNRVLRHSRLEYERK